MTKKNRKNIGFIQNLWLAALNLGGDVGTSIFLKLPMVAQLTETNFYFKEISILGPYLKFYVF